MKKIIITVFIFVICLTAWGRAEELLGKCVGVADGDTCTILIDGNETRRIRFYGIDAPESGQDFGKKAKEYCSNLIFGKNIKVIGLATDKYGRTVGKVFADNKYINLEMVKAGFAWHYAYYSPNDLDLAEAEKEARQKKLGLWIQPNPMEPREYRLSNSNKMVPVDRTKITIEGPFWVSHSGKIHNKYCEVWNKVKNKVLTDFPVGENCKACGGTGKKTEN